MERIVIAIFRVDFRCFHENYWYSLGYVMPQQRDVFRHVDLIGVLVRLVAKDRGRFRGVEEQMFAIMQLF